MMRKLLFLGILFLAGFISKAQKVYFVYLESENTIPFYVKMGDKVYSSSIAGYVILPNLKDSTYTISIGLVRKRDVEPKFQIVVGATDHGYLIKDLGQNLNLFDLQSLELMAPIAAVEVENETYITRTDNFTKTLSQAVDDPSLLLEVVRKEPVKTVAKNKSGPKETVAEQAVSKEAIAVNSVSIDTITSSKVDTAALAITNQEITNIDTAINKVDTASSVTSHITDSTTVALIDASNRVDSLNNNRRADSVSAADTVAKEVIAKVEEKKGDNEKVEDPKKEENNLAVVALNSDSTQNTQTLVSDTLKGVRMNEVGLEYKRSTVVRRSESSTTKGFGLTFIDYLAETSDTINILIPNPKPFFKTAVEPKSEIKATLKMITDIEATAQIDSVSHDLPIQRSDSIVSVPNVASTCNQTATERDFRNLRKEMAALDTDEGMVNIAALAFREKCFTTEQVKNLSTLFLTAQWKYQFFEAAQKYIADVQNFASLEVEIKDEYYINRFKALLAK